MSQGFAIELYFDPALENQVLKAWNVLARRQMSTHLMEIESRPHITLLSSPFLDPQKLQNVVRNFASKQEPLGLTFSTIGSFGDVLFLSPTPSSALLHLHSQLCDALKKESIEIGEDYCPDMWIPYCSVAEEVPRSRMAEAFCILRDMKLPVSGYAMDIALVEFSPLTQEIFSFSLGRRTCGGSLLVHLPLVLRYYHHDIIICHIIITKISIKGSLLPRVEGWRQETTSCSLKSEPV